MSINGSFMAVIIFFLLLAALAAVRLFYFYAYQKGRPHPRNLRRPCRLMVILGSGGHTMESLCLLEKLDVKKYHPVTFVLAETDTTSSVRAVAAWKGPDDEVKFVRIPRSREVHQSWTSTVLSTSRAALSALPIVFRERPDMILCNGPGTCVPICLIAWILTLSGLHRTVITFVESICRVKTLSLTGKILYFITDMFFVQYESLSKRYPGAVYLGRLV